MIQQLRISSIAKVIAVFTAILACAASPGARAQGMSAAEWDKIVAAAKKEGKVVFYTATVVPVMQRIKAEFEKVYPEISLEWIRFPSGPLMAKVDQERKAGVTSVDVVSSTEVGWFEDRLKEGTLVRPVGPDAAKFPEKFLVRGAIPILSIDALVIMVNTNLVKTPITGHADLLRPEFKGKIATLDLLSTTVIAFNNWLEDSNGAGYLDRLAAQKLTLYTSTVGGGQSLAAGEFAVATFINAGAAVPLVQSGAPVKIVYPKPGFGFGYGAGIVSWAGNPNAAKVFMNFMMGPRGQQAWNGNNDSASPLPNIPGSLDSSALQLADLSKFPPQVAKPFTARWNKLFK